MVSPLLPSRNGFLHASSDWDVKREKKETLPRHQQKAEELEAKQAAEEQQRELEEREAYDCSKGDASIILTKGPQSHQVSCTAFVIISAGRRLRSRRAWNLDGFK